MVWSRMLGRGYIADTVAYTSMIHGFCKAGFFEQGLNIFNKMLCQGSESQPDVVTYNTLFNCLCTSNNISRAIDLLNHMLNHGCDPDSSTCNIFLKTLKEKLDPPQDGREFLDELVIRLCKRQRGLAASRILQLMLQQCLPPDASTWEGVLQECCKPKKIAAAIEKCQSNLFG